MEDQTKIRDYLRKKAKQVKMFEVDETFVKGQIITHERKDLGSKGYEPIKRVFESFEELKKYYDRKPAIETENASPKPRGRPKINSRSPKKKNS